MAEFHRVLRPSSGRAVLLTNMTNSDRLAAALSGGVAASGKHRRLWTVTCRRRLTLGHMEAVLFLASPCPYEASDPSQDSVAETHSAGFHYLNYIGLPIAGTQECSASMPKLPPESMRLPWENKERGRTHWSIEKAD